MEANVIDIKFESKFIQSELSDQKVRSTKATIKFDEGSICGFSTQNVKDNDVKVLGQKAAINNAFLTSKLTKEERIAVWKKFKGKSKAADKLLLLSNIQ